MSVTEVGGMGTEEIDAGMTAFEKGFTEGLSASAIRLAEKNGGNFKGRAFGEELFLATARGVNEWARGVLKDRSVFATTKAREHFKYRVNRIITTIDPSKMSKLEVNSFGLNDSDLKYFRKEFAKLYV